jgi:precorrin-6B methylase 2
MNPHMAAHEILAEIISIEENSALREEANFTGRAEAIDYLEFNVIERIDGLLQNPNPEASMIPQKRHAERIKRQLEEIDERMFLRLRAEIRTAGEVGAMVREMLDKYVGADSGISRQNHEIGYGILDTFMNGLLHFQPIPPETQAREMEMVFFQKTPARIILEMVEKAHLTNEDVFYDLGSGLGQVPILVNLLTGAAAKGIEIEPAYSDYARACAADLNLTRMEFIHADARNVDYSAGTVFFLYTPFEGKILEAVLEKLRCEIRKGSRLFTFGPCTLEISRKNWLKNIEANGDDIGADRHRLGLFESH